MRLTRNGASDRIYTCVRVAPAALEERCMISMLHSRNWWTRQESNLPLGCCKHLTPPWYMRARKMVDPASAALALPRCERSVLLLSLRAHGSSHPLPFALSAGIPPLTPAEALETGGGKMETVAGLCTRACLGCNQMPYSLATRSKMVGAVAVAATPWTD